MADWYQRQGEYPYQDWHDVSDSNVYPDDLWKQVEGDYPYRGWHDVSDSNIYPDNLWKQTDGIYPYRGWHDVSDSSTYPKYAGLWFQRDGNIPYMDWIDIPSVSTYPEMLWKQRPSDVPHRKWARFPKLPSKADPIDTISVILPCLSYSVKSPAKLYETADDIEVLDGYRDTLDDLLFEKEELGITTETEKDFGDEYNSHVNGNVDYNLRHYLTADDLNAKGWDVEEGGTYTTYDMDFFIYEENSDNVLYTVKLTMIQDDANVLTRSELNDYFDDLAAVIYGGGDMYDVLTYDREHDKIIINIKEGEETYDQEGFSELDRTLDPIKQKHAIMHKINETTSLISEYSARCNYIQYEIILEGCD